MLFILSINKCVFTTENFCSAFDFLLASFLKPLYQTFIFFVFFILPPFFPSLLFKFVHVSASPLIQLLLSLRDLIPRLIPPLLISLCHLSPSHHSILITFCPFWPCRIYEFSISLLPVTYSAFVASICSLLRHWCNAIYFCDSLPYFHKLLYITDVFWFPLLHFPYAIENSLGKYHFLCTKDHSCLFIQQPSDELVGKLILKNNYYSTVSLDEI